MNSQSTRLIITILPIGASYITPITRALFLILYRLTAITIPITGVYARRVLAGRGASLMPPGGTAAVNYRVKDSEHGRGQSAVFYVGTSTLSHMHSGQDTLASTSAVADLVSR